MKTKLSGQSVGSKEWWSGVKQQQGLSADNAIPPLVRPDGSVAMRDKDKAELLAAHFSSKMSVPDPLRAPPKLPSLTRASLESLTVTTEEVKNLLLQIDPKKALGPDNISPHLLKRCAGQLALPLTTIFNNIFPPPSGPHFGRKQEWWPYTRKKANRTQRTTAQYPSSPLLGKSWSPL